MLLALLLLLQAGSVSAPCPVPPAAPPAGLEGWTARTPLTASPHGELAVRLNGPAKGRLVPVTLKVGQAATVTLRPAAAVRLPVTPAKPAATGSFSGVLSFTAPAAGRYRVALGAGAWVDVVSGGAALPSVSHGHGPACSGIRKIVDFDLKPGRYQLQLVGSPTATMGVMVAPAG